MKYSAKEFIRYVIAYDEGEETYFSERRDAFYERLFDWIHGNVPKFESLAEWKLRALAEGFDLPPRFFETVYSHALVIDGEHADSVLFGFSRPENVRLFADMLSEGVFDEYISDPGGCEFSSFDSQPKGLLSYVVTRMVETGLVNGEDGEDKLMAVYAAWIARAEALKKRGRRKAAA